MVGMRNGTCYCELFEPNIKTPQLIQPGGMGYEQVNVIDDRYILVYNEDFIKRHGFVMCTVMDTWKHNKFKYIDILK